jgi:CRISPR-associated protein Cas4
MKDFVYDLIYDLAEVDTQLAILALLCIATVFVLDAVTAFIARQKREHGVSARSATVSIDGGKELPVRQYISERQGLAGRPDAIVIEDGFVIPIEVKPLARKIRDRYVAQLLVYLRLIEEFEGKRPPHGYLILGSNNRRVKIENSPQRQAWLERYLVEMREILAGGAARPAPHPAKCAKCDVRQHCATYQGKVATNLKPKSTLALRAESSPPSDISEPVKT